MTKKNDVTFATDPASELTKREHFAALIFQGMLACARDDGTAAEAVGLADALIAALNIAHVPVATTHDAPAPDVDD